MSSALAENLLSPVILAFLLGIISRLVRSDLRMPDPAYAFLSIYLLVAIGLKGGGALSETKFAVFLWPLLGTLLLGVITPAITYFAARRFGKFDKTNAGALAAHYGSVSAVTFLAGLAFLERRGVMAEEFMPALLAILEIPGIAVGIFLGKRGASEGLRMRALFHEILAGKSFVLLLGGLFIGLLAGKARLAPLAPFFVEPFQGALFIFLLALGLQCGKHISSVFRHGVFLFVAGILLAMINGSLGILVADCVGLSVGGAVMLGILAGSASYIAAPAAVRLAMPEANPSLYLTASLVITFSFNVTLGIPFLYFIASTLYGV